jgi:hypothetical protein
MAVGSTLKLPRRSVAAIELGEAAETVKVAQNLAPKIERNFREKRLLSQFWVTFCTD